MRGVLPLRYFLLVWYYSIFPIFLVVCYTVLMVKKKISLKSKKHVQRTDTHWVVRRSLLSYAILVFVLFVSLALSLFFINRLIVNKENTDRYDKIMGIYSKLDLDKSYRAVKSDVFGDKRVYSWDKGRSYSSSQVYARNATPADTAADLQKKIEAAGFQYVQTEYADSTNPVFEYRNKSGNWIRVSPESKFVYDAYTFGTTSASDPLVNHKDEAPSYVTIKVNLDDNNE